MLPVRCGVEPLPCDPKVSLPGFFFAKRDQVGQRVQGEFRAHDDQIGDLRQHRDRHEILRPVGQPPVKALVHGERPGRRDEQGGAVALRLRGKFRRDIAAGAGAVLDHDRLAPFGRELIGRDAGEHVVEPAAGERDEEFDRTRWKRRLRGRWGGCRGGEQDGAKREGASQGRCGWWRRCDAKWRTAKPHDGTSPCACSIHLSPSATPCGEGHTSREPAPPLPIVLHDGERAGVRGRCAHRRFGGSADPRPAACAAVPGGPHVLLPLTLTLSPRREERRGERGRAQLQRGAEEGTRASLGAVRPRPYL